MRKTILLLVFVILLSGLVSALDSLSDNLIHYYNFEQTVDHLEDQAGAIDSTSEGTQNRTHNFIHNNAWCFKGGQTHGVLFTGGVGIDNLEGVTLNAWAYLDTAGSVIYDIANGHSALGELKMRRHSSGITQFVMTTDDKVEGGHDGAPDIPLNKVMMFTLSYNSTDGVCFFINGTLIDCDTDAGGLVDSPNPFAIGCTRTGLGTYEWSGCIDEFGIWDRKLSATELTALYNSGNGFFDFDFTTSTANITNYPNIRNNTLGQNISVSCTNNGNATLWFGTDADPVDRVAYSQYDNISWYINDTVVTSEGLYFYKGGCSPDGDSGTNSSIYNFTYDTTAPAIVLNANNFFASDNSSRVDRTVSTIFNITVTDNYDLYAIQLNVSRGNTRIWNYTNLSLSGTSATVAPNISLKGELLGQYNVTVEVADSHTDEEIGEYFWEEINNGVHFITEEGNDVKIWTPQPSNATATKELDRYTITFDFQIPGVAARTFFIESDNELHFRNLSDFWAHFVVLNGLDIRRGNWIDFETGMTDDDPVIVQQAPTKWMITFPNLPDHVEFDSIGGLNELRKDYMFNLTSDYPTNLEIIVNSNVAFNYTADFNTIAGFNITAYVNDILDDRCNCTNCSIVGDRCQIPVWFYTDNSEAILQVNISNSSYSFGIDNCSDSFDIPSEAYSLNITFYDQDDAAVNVSYESFLTFWSTHNTSETVLGNFSQDTPSLKENKMCIYPRWANYSVNQQIEYSSQSVIYDYFLTGYKYSNETKILDLYTQNGTTQVLFTVLDRGDDLENAYIHILKYDVGSGSYTTTEILRTDAQGQAIGNIILGTTFYTFLIYYDDALVYTETGVKLLSTTRTFNVNLLGGDWLDDFSTTLGIPTNLYYNNVTHNFVYLWTDSEGALHYVCLRVDKFNESGQNTLVDNCTASASGMIVFNIDPIQNGTEYVATGYFKFDNEIIDKRISIVFAALRAFFRTMPTQALFFSFFMILVLFLIGVPNPTIALTFMGLGVIVTYAFGMFMISGLWVGGIVLMIIITVYLMGRQDR